jgi:hypothetical protein
MLSVIAVAAGIVPAAPGMMVTAFLIVITGILLLIITGLIMIKMCTLLEIMARLMEDTEMMSIFKQNQAWHTLFFIPLYIHTNKTILL